MNATTEPKTTDRAQHEIEHGKWLAANDTETTWGWGTPAGQLRAKRRAELIAAAAQLAPGSRALEIGCGTGNFTQHFEKSGANILAVDISEDLLAKARARNLPADRIRFSAAPFEQCDASGPFDAIIGSSVLHHLDLAAGLPKMFDLLKPGGRFAFAEPNMLNPQVWLERHVRFLFPYVSPDEIAFVRWKFQRTLEHVGFVDVKLTPFDWLHPSTPRPLIGIVGGIGKCLEALPLFREFSGSLCISARKPQRAAARAA